MNSFTEVFAKKNYLRVVEKSGTYGYTMFPVKQTFMKKDVAPLKVRSLAKSLQHVPYLSKHPLCRFF